MDSHFTCRCTLLHEVLVRDLRNGDWSTYVGATTGRWHPKGKELFRKLAAQSRLRDPHVDPSRPRYQNFIQLLLAARRAPATRLEIHRCCYEGPPGNRTVFTGANQAVLEQRFRNAWGATLQAAGVSASVYVWPDIHDRFLISNLIGLNVSNRFDESADPTDSMWLTRLSRQDADGVQRDHDIAFNRHHYIIQIP